MKKNIHPDYNYVSAKCQTCSAEHKIGTTAQSYSIDVCSKCHAFYTGNSQSVKSTGRVERFNRMVKKAKSVKK